MKEYKECKLKEEIIMESILEDSLNKNDIIDILNKNDIIDITEKIDITKKIDITEKNGILNKYKVELSSILNKVEKLNHSINLINFKSHNLL